MDCAVMDRCAVYWPASRVAKVHSKPLGAATAHPQKAARSRPPPRLACQSLPEEGWIVVGRAAVRTQPDRFARRRGLSARRCLASRPGPARRSGDSRCRACGGRPHRHGPSARAGIAADSWLVGARRSVSGNLSESWDALKPASRSCESLPPSACLIPSRSSNWIDQQSAICDTDFPYTGCAELLHGLEDPAAHNAESV